MIFIGQLGHFKERRENEYHVVDEFLILLVTYHLFCSSDLIGVGSTRQNIGWSMICVTCLILIIRLGGLALETTSQSMRFLKLKYLKRNYDKRIKEL